MSPSVGQCALSSCASGNAAVDAARNAAVDAARNAAVDAARKPGTHEHLSLGFAGTEVGRFVGEGGLGGQPSLGSQAVAMGNQKPVGQPTQAHEQNTKMVLAGYDSNGQPLYRSERAEASSLMAPPVSNMLNMSACAHEGPSFSGVRREDLSRPQIPPHVADPFRPMVGLGPWEAGERPREANPPGRDPWAPGDKVYWTLPVLEEFDPQTGPLQAGDWVTMITPMMNDLTPRSGEWWREVLRQAQEWYAIWQAADPLDKAK